MNFDDIMKIHLASMKLNARLNNNNMIMIMIIKTTMLRFKHTVLDTHFSYLGRLYMTVSSLLVIRDLLCMNECIIYGQDMENNLAGTEVVIRLVW